ncbi:MAG: ABC transporter permease [Candidatus Aminicenantes bacterium]|nr:ABC transporter permease [Candidatus Aminicenantes bacterium]
MLRLAWRNLFRNKRRTLIAGTAIAIGLAALIFTDALIRGMKSQMIASATAAFIGEGQIHRRGFRLTQEVDLTIEDPASVMAKLEQEDAVAAFAPRTLSFGMVTSPANVRSAMVVGIDPGNEPSLSRVDDCVREGDFFEGSNERDLVIGSGLADLLEVGLGDRVVITVSQAGTGDLSQDMFRVSGVYSYGVKEMDEGFAFVRLAKAQDMLGIGANIHQIALKFEDIDFATREGNPFWEAYSAGGNEAVSWAVLLPQLEGILGLVWISLAFMAVILFGIVAFGIINTLFMSLYERMFEFGVLRAVGTRPSGVRRLIVYEAGALALLSIAMGTVLGFVLTYAVTRTGLDYRGIELAGTAFYDLLYPVLQARQFVIYPLAVLAFTMLMGLYPAHVAGKMKVADALRKSL